MSFLPYFLTGLFFAPVISAVLRKHGSAAEIFLLNLTVLLWPVAFVWSFIGGHASLAGTQKPGKLKRWGFPLLAGLFALVVIERAVAILSMPNTTAPKMVAQPGRIPESMKQTMSIPEIKVPAPAPTHKEGVPMPADELFGK